MTSSFFLFFSLAYFIYSVNIVQLRDIKNPRTNSYVSMMKMTDRLLLWKMTSNLLSLYPPPSVSTLHFSLASIYLGHQPIYLPDMLFYYNLFCLFPSDFVFLCFVGVVSLFSLSFLLRLIYCKIGEIVSPP